MRRLNPRQARELVTVHPAAGRGPRGPVAGEPVTVRCRYVAQQRLVHAGDGTDVVSDVGLLASPELNPGKDLEALLVAGATVTVRGQQRRVVSAGAAINRGRVIVVTAQLA